MRLYSIICPHRNRNKRLALCIWSIKWSARQSDITNYEIIVSDQGSDVLPLKSPNVKVIPDCEPLSVFQSSKGPVSLFSKPRAINRGIDAARGNVLSFVDADAIVGRYWLLSQRVLRHKSHEAQPTRLCYRVKYLPKEMAETLQPNPQGQAIVRECFRRYNDGDHFPQGHEGYASPEIDATGCYDPKLTFGNSQFSIRRDVLGDVRCDERYVGAGWEDLAFIAAIWQQAGSSYVGEMVTEPARSMFHIASEREPDWHNSDANRANHERYLAMLKD